MPRGAGEPRLSLVLWALALRTDFQIIRHSRVPGRNGSATAASFGACLSVSLRPDIAAGLVGGEGFAVDASLIAADANKQRSIPGKDWDSNRAPEKASRAVKEYLAALDDAAFGAASDTAPKFVSPSDPAAQWTGAKRGPAFFAYSDNYLVDVKFGVIMDVEASRAIRQAEVGTAKTMVELHRKALRYQANKRFAADTAYGSGSNLNWLVNDKDIEPHIPVIDKSKRNDGTFSREDFTSTRSTTSTPARRARTSRRQARWSTTERHFYIWRARRTAVAARSRRGAAQRCLSAGFRAAFTRRPATLPGRWPRLPHSRNHAATGSVLMMLFAHLKRMKLGRLRLRGPRGAQDEFTLAAIAQNLRRLAKLVVRPPPAVALYAT